MITDTRRSGVAELSTEVAYQRVDPDAFDGFTSSMEGVELAASLSVAEILPVRGFVTVAGEARLLDEGFYQDRPVCVPHVPVVCQTASGESQDTRGEILALDPRQDEEARVVDDEVQVARALLWAPADRRIAGLGLPGTRTEAEQGHDVAAAASRVGRDRKGVARRGARG